MAQRAEFEREMMKRTELFSRLGDAQLDALLTGAKRRKLKNREELCHKGDEGNQLFLIQTGRLKAITHSTEGGSVTFTVMGPGEIIVELALFGAGVRSATVTAMEASHLLVFERRDFLQVVRDNADLAVELLQLLARRVLRLSDTVADAQFLNLPARLAKKLVALDKSHGRDAGEGREIGMKLSQGELADLVATTRESVNKQVGIWREEGILSMESGRIVLHRLDALREIAASARS